MKKYLDAFPAFASAFFLIYIAINPVSLGPIIAFVASSCLFAYQQYLFRTEQPDLKAEFAALRAETAKLIAEDKEKYHKEMSQIKDEMGKVGMSLARNQVSTEKPRERQKVQF
jgi:hypothetical protein